MPENENPYCHICQNTGYMMKPTDQERFDKEYNRLDATGVLEPYLCYRKACQKTGYIKVPCTYCNLGERILEEES